MDSISPVLNNNSKTPLYIQLYCYIRDAILAGDIPPKEKLPSLRNASNVLHLSVTTIEQAYNQLVVEGYLENRPQSGYYVNDILRRSKEKPLVFSKEINLTYAAGHVSQKHYDSLSYLDDSVLSNFYFDPACFDFVKWKKCCNKILCDYSNFLLLEADPQGEAPLRYEISKYIYQARGVRCQPNQIVIGAGTQQLISLLCTLLSKLEIEYAAFEEPGYLPVREGFKERGFKMTTVPLDKDGIQIDKLPANIRSVAYVSPSNQFPTGAVMPVARCYSLLDWAQKNNSIIIEDDYNSELRYLGKASPSLQGMDENQRVVYLGSFSSTLFPSVKISYLVLPVPMMDLFSQMLSLYTQTCSKTEQLTLALYMEKGLYQTNIKKLRNLYAQKMQLATGFLKKYLGNDVQVLANSSGLHMLLSLNLPSHITVEFLCEQAKEYKLPLTPVSSAIFHRDENGFPTQRVSLIFYYTRIPIDQMKQAVGNFSTLLLKQKNS